MKKIKIIILFIATSMLLCACPKDENGQEFIYITNNSNEKIAFQILKNKEDKTFYCSDVGIMILPIVESNSTFKLNDGGTYSSWNTSLNLLTIFMLDGELYEEYWQQPCDTIRKYVPVLHTYRLTLKDLQTMDWVVNYPPE